MCIYICVYMEILHMCIYKYKYKYIYTHIFIYIYINIYESPMGYSAWKPTVHFLSFWKTCLEDLLGSHAWETCWEDLPGLLGRLAWETCLVDLYTWRTCFSHWGHIECTHVFKHLPTLRIHQNHTPALTTLTPKGFASFRKPGPLARGLCRSGGVYTRPTDNQLSHPWTLW